MISNSEPHWILLDPDNLDLGLSYPGGSEPLFAWNTTNGIIQAPEVYFLISLSYNETKQKISQISTTKGIAYKREERLLASELGAPWLEAAAQNLLVNGIPEETPGDNALRQAVSTKAILEKEIPWRREARRFSQSSPITEEVLNRLTIPVSVWTAKGKRITLGKSWYARIEMELTDTSFLFGPQTCVLRLQRVDTGPNPHYVSTLRKIGVLLKILPEAEWNILAGPQSKTIERRTVPGPEFAALFEGLSVKGVPPRVDQSPLEWVSKPVDNSSSIPYEKISLDHSIESTLYSWSTLGFSERSMRSTYLLAAAGANGLVIGAHSFDDTTIGTDGVFLMYPEGDIWKSTLLWKGPSLGNEIHISPDGSLAWFIAGVIEKDGSAGDDRMHQIHLKTREVSSWELHYTDGAVAYWFSRWILDSKGIPFTLSSDMAYSVDSPVTIEEFLVEQQPSQTGSVIPRVAIPRSAYTQKPMSIIGSSAHDGYWILDESIAEIDPLSGETRIAYEPVWGTSDGIHPPPLLFSPTSAIIPFTVKVNNRTGKLIRSISSNEPNSIWSGISLIHLDNGKSSQPILLHKGGITSLARSPESSLIACTIQANKENNHGILMHISSLTDNSKKAAFSLILTSDKKAELNSLAFSRDGKLLFGLASNGLHVWTLPSELRENPTAENFPTQNHR